MAKKRHNKNSLKEPKNFADTKTFEVQYVLTITNAVLQREVVIYERSAIEVTIYNSHGSGEGYPEGLYDRIVWLCPNLSELLISSYPVDKLHTFSIKKLYVVKLSSTTTFFLASPNFDFTPSFTTWTATFARISVTVFRTGVITANVAIALIPLLIFKTSLT
ncbi:4376_t:CDS:2 [Rhizophagus irregularis]|nr:4376_t:CDS:2 [Rhizophagus irregularis]